jgi:hypothetical protein
VKRSRSRLIRRATRERFVVTTFSGETWEGVLMDADGVHYVLADAAQIDANGDRLPADGQMWLPAEAVAYLQQPTAGI